MKACTGLGCDFVLGSCFDPDHIFPYSCSATEGSETCTADHLSTVIVTCNLFVNFVIGIMY